MALSPLHRQKRARSALGASRRIFHRDWGPRVSWGDPSKTHSADVRALFWWAAFSPSVNSPDPAHAAQLQRAVPVVCQSLQTWSINLCCCMKCESPKGPGSPRQGRRGGGESAAAPRRWETRRLPLFSPVVFCFSPFEGVTQTADHTKCEAGWGNLAAPAGH